VGCQFLPMNLPDYFNFIGIAHTADERIHVEVVEFGTNAIYKGLALEFYWGSCCGSVSQDSLLVSTMLLKVAH